MPREIVAELTYHGKDSDTQTSVQTLVHNLGSAGLLENCDEVSVQPNHVRIPLRPVLGPNGERRIPFVIGITHIPGTVGGGILDNRFQDLPNGRRYYLVQLSTRLEGKSLDISYFYEDQDSPNNKYKLDLALRTASTTSERTVMTDELLPDFTGFGFHHRIKGDPALSGVFSSLHQRLVPKEAVKFGVVNGLKKKDGGFHISVNLSLQDPNPDSYSNCYQVELSTRESTTEVVPGTIWQENEGHYCMIGQGGYYPFVPPLPEFMNSLAMEIHSTAGNPGIINLMREIPLSVNGNNSWFARKEFNDERIEVLHSPNWGNHNLAFTYHTESRRRITSKTFRYAADQLLALSQRLA